jgi:HPt (histidine-containing phosphotransfer) domain-containing protein
MIDPAILDLARLHEIYEGDRAGIADLLDLAVQTAQTQLQAIESAVGRRNAGEIRGAAHAIKGASLNVGAVETARLSAELEAAALSEGWETIPGKVAALREGFARFADSVARFSREG